MSPIRMERVESGVRVVIAFNEAFNRHDVAGMLQLMSTDCVYEYTSPAPDGVVYTGKEALARFWPEFFAHIKDAHIKVEEIFGYGLRCIMRWRLDWVDEAGTRGHVRGVDLFRVQNGLIVEAMSYLKA